MSYTNGGQTIDKSMNGIITFDTGDGVVIEGGTITATDVITDNITCETIEVNSSATFNGTASFNTALPTSVITSTTSDDEFITKAIGDTLYAGGGILSSNNTWTGQNYYNTILPTSTLTGTPTATQIAPVAMLNNLYGRLASLNTWTANNIFGGVTSVVNLKTLFISWAGTTGDLIEQTFNTVTGVMMFLSYLQGTTPQFDFAFIPASVAVVAFRIQQTVSTFFTRVIIDTPATTSSGTPALELTNSATTPSTIDMYVSATASTGNPLVTAGDNAIIGSAGALTIAIESATTCGFRIFSSDITVRGTLNIREGCAFTTALPTTSVTTTTATNQIAPIIVLDTLYGRLATGVTNAWASTNTFVLLPSTTTTFTTATANQFITRSIGDALYPAIPTGGYARLTTVNNTFTNNNTFLASGGTGNTIMYGAGVYLSAGDNVAESTNNVANATPAFKIRGRSADTKTIKFIPNATASALNPAVLVNDGVISADSVLTLTADGATASGIRILDTGVVNVVGTTTNLNATNTIMAGTGAFLQATNNVAESTSNVALATPAFRIRGRSSDTKTIKFIPQATVGALNPLVLVNDGVISADTNLTLTADSTILTGIRITDVGGVYIDGVTTFLDATNLFVDSASTFNQPIKFGYVTLPPFVDFQIGYNIEPISNTITAPNANTIYQGNSFTLTRGVWIVKAFCGIYATINQARVYMSINTNNTAHDVGNRTFVFCNAGGLGDISFEVNKVFVVPTAGQTYYVLVSSNLANPNSPTYFVSYQATRIA